MTIRKITGSEGGFCIVPNKTLNDALSWEAIGLLAYLCSKPDNWRVSVTQLANHSHKSVRPSGRDKTYRILKELQDAGYVKRVKSRNKDGKYGQVEYLVSPDKISKNIMDELFLQPLTENPEVVNGKNSQPLTENPEVVEIRGKQPINQAELPQLASSAHTNGQPLTENPEVVNGKNSQPLTENPEVVEQTHSQPLPDLPDPVNPTLQKKESNKRKSVIAREKNSLKTLKRNQTELFRETGVKTAPKPKSPFTKEFLEFWEAYPQTTGSQKTAFNQWKRLNKGQKQQVIKSLPQYKRVLERMGTDDRGRYYVLHPNKYLRDEHYKTYQPVDPVLEPADSVLINDRRFLHKTIVEACVTYLRSGNWRLESTLGPPPDHPETKIPEFLSELAGKIARESK